VQNLLLASSDEALYIWFGLGHRKLTGQITGNATFKNKFCNCTDEYHLCCDAIVTQATPRSKFLAYFEKQLRVVFNILSHNRG